MVVGSDGDGLSTHLDLNFQEEGKWTVSGTFQGKPLEAEIEHGLLNSELLERKRQRRFLPTAKPGDILHGYAWIHDLDPTAITSIDLRFVEAQDEFYVATAQVGEMEMTFTIDASGALVRGFTEVSGVKIVNELIYQSGVFPDVPLVRVIRRCAGSACWCP